jgi:23S rRNA pseudouridine955/2504/2580 synthase
VHAASSDNPILGDPKYGDEGANQILRTMGLRRLFLHAASLRFEWPGVPGGFHIEADLPVELKSVLRALEAHEQALRADRF